MKSVRGVLKSRVFIAAVCLLAGVFIVLAIRFMTYQTPSPEKVHYHANFAVYVNGQREQFSAPNYYEEVAQASCSLTSRPEDNPMSRVHMHDNINDVAHVEDHLVTWGNFFTVMGWGAGKNYLSTRSAVYTPSDQAQLTYLLNGKEVNDISNVIIGDQDKLLVNYGPQTQTEIQQEYGQIQNKAKAEDNSKDPVTCGSSAEVKTTFQDRITHLF